MPGEKKVNTIVLILSLVVSIGLNAMLVVKLVQRARRCDELKIENEKLELLSDTDQLTRLLNRRGIERGFAQLIGLLPREVDNSRAKPALQGLGAALIDIDHFKDINDLHGHGAGDAVLKLLAARLRELTRRSDVVGRWGGDEFVIFLPNVTEDDLKGLANRCCQTIASSELYSGRIITVSIGVAHMKVQKRLEDFFAQADGALYVAKEGGRDQVACAWGLPKAA